MKDTDRNAEIEQIICSRLTEKRFYHSLCVAEKARELAQRWGADPDKAYTAGLMHDIMKDAPKEEQLQTLENAGIILTQTERANPKLWHAMAGYAYLRDTLCVKDKGMLKAVRYHTTGRKRMSLLEKVVYIADFISNDRDYDGVEEMRAYAQESIEKAMFEGMKFTISELAQAGQAIHPDTLMAYNEMIVTKTEEDG